MVFRDGKTLPIRPDSQVIIGPTSTTAENFESSTAAKTKFLELIKPIDLGLRINRVRLGSNKSIIIEGDSCNLEILQNCSELRESKLEVKENCETNPRLIIHDVPDSLKSDDIGTALLKQNFPNYNLEDFKVIYLFGIRKGKSVRSCIVEMPPECRKILCKANRVFFGAPSCSCADHVTIVQCFNCYKFGHIAKDCTNDK